MARNLWFFFSLALYLSLLSRHWKNIKFVLIKNEYWKNNNILLVKTSSFWMKKVVIWWLFDGGLRARGRDSRALLFSTLSFQIVLYVQMLLDRPGICLLWIFVHKTSMYLLILMLWILWHYLRETVPERFHIWAILRRV